MALALSTWKSVANKGASSGARDEYKFRVVQSSVNSTTHTASYKVQFYGTDTSRYGTYEHYMNAVKLKVNGTTVATLLNSKIHMGSGRSSGYTAKYSSSSPYTTSSYTLGPLKEGDKVTVALDSSINTGDTFRYTSDTISVSSSIFAPSSYTLTYTANGGTGSNVTQSVNAGSAATLKAASTFTPATTATWGITLNKDGGTGGDATFVNNAFYRWLIGSSYYKAGASYTPSANTTVKAYWSTNYKLGTPTKASTTANGYTVTFNAQGGSCNTTSLTQKNTTSYTFGGWKSDSSGTVYNGGTTLGGPAKYSYTAQWTSTTTKGSITMPSVTKSSSSNKTVTLNYDGATGNNSTTSLSYTKTTTYPFKGWSADQTATSGSAIGSSFTPTASGTVYAIWGSASNSYSKITLPIPTKTNYKFNGWATTSGGTVVSTGGDYTPTSDITTLYAKWTLNTFTVTFNKNGGNTPNPTSKTVTQGSTYGTLATCTRTGYTLKGWYTAASGGTKVTSSTTVNLTANQTLYAQWTPITYTIAYNANGGTGTTASSSHTYGTAKALTANGFTKFGYTFKGWATTLDRAKAGYVDRTDKESVSNLSATNGAIVNLYAVWEIYTRTYIYTNKKDGTSQWVPVEKYTYNTITFSSTYLYDDYSGTEYAGPITYEVGQTWSQWCSSKYNTHGLYCSGNYIYGPGGTQLWSMAGNAVLSSDVINSTGYEFV